MPEYILLTNAKHLQNWVLSSWITGTIWPTSAVTGLSVGTLLNETFSDWSQKLSPSLELGVGISCRTGQQQTSQALSYNTESTTSLGCSLLQEKLENMNSSEHRENLKHAQNDVVPFTWVSLQGWSSVLIMALYLFHLVEHSSEVPELAHSHACTQTTQRY